jgi:hypothetical protein
MDICIDNNEKKSDLITFFKGFFSFKYIIMAVTKKKQVYQSESESDQDNYDYEEQENSVSILRLSCLDTPCRKLLIYVPQLYRTI